MEQALTPWFSAARRMKNIVGLLALLAIGIVFSPIAHDNSNIFLQPGNLTDILRQVSVVGIIALPMTFVILTGGIDLSVGSTLALATSLLAMFLTRGGPANIVLHSLYAVAWAAAASASIGLLNGFVVAGLRMPPFIVTLASMIGVRGLAKWLTRNENIDIGFGTDAAARFAALVNDKKVIVGSFVVLAIVFWVVLERTVFGRYVRAIGDNEKAGRYTGLPIAKIKVWVYALTGLLTGIAGVIYAAENHQGNPNAGVAYELDVIAAVVIGGTSLSGGSGSITGTVIGTLTVGVLTNLLRLQNVDSNVEMMIKAGIILAAVALGSTGKKR